MRKGLKDGILLEPELSLLAAIVNLLQTAVVMIIFITTIIISLI
jgi:hypothetical protein